MIAPSRGTRLACFVLIAASVVLVAQCRPALGDDLAVDFAGEVDSDGPLVIAPHADDDPRTVVVSNSLVPVYFIQRMPQTKAVVSVTLGDLGRESCSDQHPTARLWVSESSSHDFDSQANLGYTNAVELPPEPGRMTWTFDYLASGGTTLMLRAGHTYSFRIGITGCSSFRQTTWAPLQPKLESPSETCATGLPFGSASGYRTRRQWHDDLVSPGDGCVSSYNTDFLANGWPYLPDGWLVSVDSSIARISNTHAAPDPSAPCGDASWADAGITQLNVETMMGFEGGPGSYHHVQETDGICAWDNYYPPGQATRYAWSTSLPLRPEFDGAPRLPYVRLDTVDWDNTLLQAYAPALKFDSSEAFLPQAVDGLTSIRQTAPDCAGDATMLAHPNGEPYLDTTYATAKDSGCPGDDRLDLGNLRAEGTDYPYHDTTRAGNPLGVVSADDILNLRGSSGGTYQADSAAIFAEPGWARRTYGHAVMSPDGDLWLQYWFWYYYNNGNYPEQDDHEGDWEGIQLHFSNPLGTNPTPDHATYNEHDFHSRCDWDHVEKSENGHPVVYVSRGRHASYFNWLNMPSGAHPFFPDETDARPYTPSYQVTVEPITTYTPAWMRWPGRWGSSSGDLVGSGMSPRGPAFQSSWADPAEADASAETGNCGFALATAAKARVHRDLTAHSTSGDGPAPRITTSTTSHGTIRVHWSVPAGHRVPMRLLLATHAIKVLAPAVSTWTRIGATRRGVTELALPKVRGPYELVARFQWKGEGHLGAEAVKNVRPTSRRR
jgi:hypothetical protein